MKQIVLAALLMFAALRVPAWGDIAAYFSVDGVNDAGSSLTIQQGTTFSLYVMVTGQTFAGYDIGISVSGPAMVVATYQGSLVTGHGAIMSLYDPISQTDRSGALLLSVPGVSGTGSLASFDISCTGYGDTTISISPDSYLGDPCGDPIWITGGSITVHQVPAPASLVLLMTGLAALVVRRIRAGTSSS